MNFICIIDPFLQCFLCNCRTSRIIGKAQVDQIRCLIRKLRCKAVFLGTGHVYQSLICAQRFVIYTGSACHDIRIHIDRINRIADRNKIIGSKNLLNISDITLCTVRYKNLIRRNLAAPCCKILFCNRV